MKLLIQRGADIHSENETPLCLAAACQHQKLVRMLLECGADGHTAIKVSNETGQAKISSIIRAELRWIKSRAKRAA